MRVIKKQRPFASKMNKQQLLKELVLDFHYEKDQIVHLPRKDLANIVKQNRKGEDATKTLPGAKPIPEETDAKKVVKTFDTPPLPTDYDWTQYVLGLFKPDEQQGENPTVDGLRRVAQALLGPIEHKRAWLVDAPRQDNNFKATVKVRIVYGNGKVYEAIADAGPDNCDSDFARFAASVAETRAEGRCHRQALLLRKTLAAEENLVSNVPLSAITTGGLIQPGQLSAIQIMADRIKVSIMRTITACGIEKKQLRDLTHGEALTVINKLNAFQQDPKSIPKEIKRG